MKILLSNHFVERYRERMLDMAPSAYKLYTKDYKYKLGLTMSEVIPKADKILFKDIEKEKQDYLHKKYNKNNMVFFKRKNVIYCGAYIKNDFSNKETILLITVIK